MMVFRIVLNIANSIEKMNIDKKIYILPRIIMENKVNLDLFNYRSNYRDENIIDQIKQYIHETYGIALPVAGIICSYLDTWIMIELLKYIYSSKPTFYDDGISSDTKFINVPFVSNDARIIQLEYYYGNKPGDKGFYGSYIIDDNNNTLGAIINHIHNIYKQLENTFQSKYTISYYPDDCMVKSYKGYIFIIQIGFSLIEKRHLFPWER